MRFTSTPAGKELALAIALVLLAVSIAHAQSPVDTAAVLQGNFFTAPGVYVGGKSWDSAIGCYPARVRDKPAGAYVTAGDIKGVSADYLQPDEAIYDCGNNRFQTDPPETALRLAAGGVRIPLSFSNLKPGLYFVRLVGRVNLPANLRIVRPLYVHLRINDGPQGEWSEYRVRVPYTKYLNETGRVYFQALADANSLQAELFVGAGSQEEFLLHRLDFFDALMDSPRTAAKTGPGTFTPEERAAVRQNAVEIASHAANEIGPDGVIYGDNRIWRWMHDSAYPAPATAQARRDRDDLIFLRCLPPINSMHSGNGMIEYFQQNYPPFPSGISTIQEFEAAYGKWELDLGGKNSYDYPWDVPWRIVNRRLNLTYTLDDYVARRPLPDPYPWKDDGTGVYYTVSDPAQNYQSPGRYYFIIAPLVFSRIQPQYYGAIFAYEGGQDLALRYHVTGNRNVAWDAALALVRFACVYPTYFLGAQDVGLNTAVPDLVYNSFTRWNRFGKFYYDGWAGTYAKGLTTAYDRLYDFIAADPDFHLAVSRYIPAVRSAQDLVRLLDTQILQSTVGEVRGGLVRQYPLMLNGLVQNPNAWADPLMDLSTSEGDIYPLGIRSLLDHYFSSLSSSGTSYIGSTFYAKGASSSLLEAFNYFKRYRALDTRPNPPRFEHDLSDLTKFPKIDGYARYLTGLWLGGGYQPAVGDVGGAPYAPRYLNDSSLNALIVDAWRVSRDPKTAWLLKQVYGSHYTLLGAAEKAEVDAAAASVARDPRVATDSRVLGGFGVGILESGQAFNDFRFKRALTLRTGTGVGHAHADALDLNIFAHGVRLANDFAQRNEGTLFTVPPDTTAYTHNTVEIDGWRHPWKADAATGWPSPSFAGGGWIELFAPLAGPFKAITGAARSSNHKNVAVFRRDVVLADAEDILAEPASFAADTLTPNSYIFDLFRVAGGQLHTWSFHDADTSGESGGFAVNAALTPVSNDAAASDTARYLRKHMLGTKFEGAASDRVEATWRLGRTAGSFAGLCNADGSCLDAATYAAESYMLGDRYLAASPRKYLKATLFDHPGKTVMVGGLVSQAYKMNIPMLYVQDRAGVSEVYNSGFNKQNLFMALYEPYVGAPFITASRPLTIPANEADALRAAALEVKTANGNRDILFSDGRERARSVTVPGLSPFEVDAHLAMFSQGPVLTPRVMALTGGARLAAGAFDLRPAARRYQGVITAVDYQARTITVDGRFPAELVSGAELHIRGPGHDTHYKVRSVQNLSPNTTLIALEGDPVLGRLPLKSVSGSTIASDDAIVLADHANRDQGLFVANEALTRRWRVNRSGGQYQAAASVSAADFTDANGDGAVHFFVYDFGPGDTATLETQVSLRRVAPNRFAVSTNVDFDFSLGTGAVLESSLDGLTWTRLQQISADGKIFSRVTMRAPHMELRGDLTAPAAPQRLRLQ